MNFMKKKTAIHNTEPAFDVSTMEDEIQTALLPPPSSRALAIPEPIDLDKITAEAILAKYEAVATVLSELGTELSERVRAIETLKAEADLALKDVLDMAQHYRELGKEASAKIERTGQIIKEVRSTCNDLKSKIERS